MVKVLDNLSASCAQGAISSMFKSVFMHIRGSVDLDWKSTGSCITQVFLFAQIMDTEQVNGCK